MIINEIKPTTKSLKALQSYVAECCSVVRDKSPKNAEKLFDRLLKESVGEQASRPLEYIPCTIKTKDIPSPMQYFGFFGGAGEYFTNARELLTWGWSVKDVVKVVNFKNYKVFKCEVPYFMYGQLSTHNQLTTQSHSQRYSQCDRGYWKPPEITMPQEQWDKVVGERARPPELVKVMKDAGITRKEVWDRGRDMLQNRVFTIGGYTNNPNAWEHFIKQRTDLHTQLETREFAEELSKLL